MQQTLDTYRAGVAITQVKMQKQTLLRMSSMPIAMFRRLAQTRKRCATRPKHMPTGSFPKRAAKRPKLWQDAEAYRQQVIAQAEGEAKRFLSVYAEYRKSPDVTRRRMYLETMSTILAPMNKIILDANVGHGWCPTCRAGSGKADAKRQRYRSCAVRQRAPSIECSSCGSPAMSRVVLVAAALALVLVFWLGTSSFYTVDPTEQVLLLQFDAP